MLFTKHIKVFVTIFCLVSFFIGYSFGADQNLSSYSDSITIPDPLIDDLSSYGDYLTKLFRYPNGSTLQVYYDNGRLVSLIVNEMNESVGFTIRNRDFSYPKVDILNSRAGFENGVYVFEVDIKIQSNEVMLGHFLLGSMRFERDFQYQKLHLRPFKSLKYSFIPEEFVKFSRIIDNLSEEQLKALKAKTHQELYSRLFLHGYISSTNCYKFVQRSINNKYCLTLEIVPLNGKMKINDDSILLYSEDNLLLRFIITSNSEILHPIDNIFNKDFWDFYVTVKKGDPSFERLLKFSKFLCYREKMLAGLPNFATYFGRDSIMFAIVMKDILDPMVIQDIIESIILRMRENGEVSHEESLGFQAIRENLSTFGELNLEYIDQPVQNYVMIDDDFQFVILTLFYLESPIPVSEKKKFLSKVYKNRTYLEWILANFSFVFEKCLPYYNSLECKDLIRFPFNGKEYISASWRDSGFGYCKGAYPMDVNCIWAPQALKSIPYIFKSLSQISQTPSWFLKTNLYDFIKTGKINDVINKWKETSKFFKVSLSKDEMKFYLYHHQKNFDVFYDKISFPDRINFFAISLKEPNCEPIKLMNTDLGMLFLISDNPDYKEMKDFYSLVVLPYPLGLFIDNVGVVCANDKYTNSYIIENFRKDTYHSPRAIWGREVNIIMLGLLKNSQTHRELYDIFEEVYYAVEKSKMKNSELWTYVIDNGVYKAVRYPSSSDLQLWNLSSLAVEYNLHKFRKKFDVQNK